MWACHEIWWWTRGRCLLGRAKRWFGEGRMPEAHQALRAFILKPVWGRKGDLFTDSIPPFYQNPDISISYPLFYPTKPQLYFTLYRSTLLFPQTIFWIFVFNLTFLSETFHSRFTTLPQNPRVSQSFFRRFRTVIPYSYISFVFPSESLKLS